MDRGTRSFGLEDNLKDNIKVIHLTINRENTFRLESCLLVLTLSKCLICFTHL